MEAEYGSAGSIQDQLLSAWKVCQHRVSNHIKNEIGKTVGFWKGMVKTWQFRREFREGTVSDIEGVVV